MKMLDGRELITLIRRCQKLLAGDSVKFLKELMIREEWE